MKKQIIKKTIYFFFKQNLSFITKNHILKKKKKLIY
jgi:hypothetical protein